MVVIAVTVVTVVRKITQPQKKIQYFCKEQFDTFDNRCDVLRAAFCDSCDVLPSRIWYLVLCKQDYCT